MISRVSLSLFLPLFSLSFGCNSAGDFKAGGGIGVTRNDDKDKEDDEDENDSADEPVEVSGSFLTCAFMDSKTIVVSNAQAKPDSSLDIACGLFSQKGNAFGPVDDSRLKLQTRILTNQGKLIAAEFVRLPLGTQMQVITTIPVKHLSGTIHVDYYDPATAKYSSRRKSIPSITSFSAKVVYNVEDDESVKRFVNNDFPLNGSIDPQDSVDAVDNEWWLELVKVIVQAFGPAQSVKASNDNGATTYKPVQQVKYPSQKPDAQSGNFPINQPNKPVATESKPNPTISKPPVDEKIVAVKPPTVDDPFEKVDVSKPTSPATTPEPKVEPTEGPKPAEQETPTETKVPTEESKNPVSGG